MRYRHVLAGFASRQCVRSHGHQSSSDDFVFIGRQSEACATQQRELDAVAIRQRAADRRRQRIRYISNSLVFCSVSFHNARRHHHRLEHVVAEAAGVERDVVARQIAAHKVATRRQIAASSAPSSSQAFRQRMKYNETHTQNKQPRALDRFRRRASIEWRARSARRAPPTAR